MPLAREWASQLAVVLVGHAPCSELIMQYAGTYGAQKHTSTQSSLQWNISNALCIRRPRGTVEEEGGGTIFAMVSGA